jgi:preprotein translocase subunit SecB
LTDETESTEPGTAPASSGNGGTDPASSEPMEGQQTAPALAINAQYIKDMSFEAPATPQIFKELQNQQPNISVHVDVKAKNIAPPAYEVVLSIKAECTINDASAFIMDLAYGGVFTVNVPEQHLRPVLLIECPRLLFPFARQIVAMTTVNGGFLPLMLGPVDFAGLYQRQAQEAQAEAQAPENSDAKLV